MSAKGAASSSPDWLDHEYYVQWAIDYGVRINGVAPARIQGTGNGLVANRSIKVNAMISHSETKRLKKSVGW